MFLILDNYDSFVHNLARYIRRAGPEVRILRNDALTVEDISALKPEALILSPGPCAPAEAGICVEAIKKLGGHIPVLGVCLGHQCIGEAYGGTTIRAPEPVHGMASPVHHDQTGLFAGLPNPFMAGRYHSLTVELPVTSRLAVTARTPEGVIMALEHPTHPVYGVQFHPESILTQHGLDLVRNFVQITKQWHQARDSARYSESKAS